MINRTFFLRAISSVCRRIDRFVITVYQNNEIRYFGDPDINLDSVARRMTAEEFRSAVYANARQMRIDAITVPAYPLDDLDEFLTALLPGCGHSQSFAGQSTPYAMLQRYEACWHLALRECGVQSDHEDLLYLRSGRIHEYEPSPNATGRSTLTMAVAREMPVAGAYNTGILASASCSGRYDMELLWMARALIELLPVPLYQCLQLGDEPTRQRIPLNINHTCYAPLSTDMTVVSRFYGGMLMALEQAAVANTSARPLAYLLDLMERVARVDNFTWGAANAIRLSDSLSGGVSGLVDSGVVGIDGGGCIIQGNDVDKLALGDNPMPVRQHLVDLHRGDAVSDILNDVWETEPELFGTED